MHRWLRQLVWLGLLLGVRVSVSEAALPPADQWRLSLVGQCVGYGCSTLQAIDFSAWSLCEVTTLADSGAGSLRACATISGPRWIVFRVNGQIFLDTELFVTSNKVFDGRVADITIESTFNAPLSLGLLTIGYTGNPATSAASNIIFANLKFKHANANCFLCIFPDTSAIWIDHCTFQNALDEIINITSVSAGDPGIPPTAITLSWNHFPPPVTSDPVPPNAIIDSDTSEPVTYWKSLGMLFSHPDLWQDTTMRITLHHNHFQNEVRNPFAFQGWFHSFNNYQDKTDIGAQIAAGADFRSERDIYEAPYIGAYLRVHPDPFDGGYPPAAHVSVTNPYLITSATYEELNPGTIFTPPYAYTPTTANETLRLAIIAGAGWQAVTAPSDVPPLILRLVR